MSDSVRIESDVLRLPGGAAVSFIRTLRLPEQGTHQLPPGLGQFPLHRVEDHPDTVPPQWLARGGVMLPVYLREAMWLNFRGTAVPCALQVGVGKVCAVSGRPWSAELRRDGQNYLALPKQPWLDGINSGSGTVRQFVAVPLGLGATVEGQVTGEETWGGVQLQSFALTGPARRAWDARQQRLSVERSLPAPGAPPAPGGAAPLSQLGFGAPPPAGTPAAAGSAPRARKAAAMGVGAGGTMRQDVYRDERPLSDYAPEPAGRVFVHLVTPPDWRRITGEAPPPSPVDRAAYTAAGLPWFSYYDEDGEDLPAAGPLSGVQPVGDWLGEDHEPWAEPGPGQIKQVGPGKPVSDGDW